MSENRMRAQDYAPPRLTLGVVGVIAIIIPILLGYFLVSGMATNVSYTFPGGATSNTTATSTGASAVTAISIPSGAGSPNGAPGYAPDSVTVVVGVNNTVTWTNNDGSTHHTVTSSSVPSGASSFNSGDLAGGATFTYNFTTPGTYKYLCSYHSWMTGTVVVVAGSGSSAVAVSIPSGAGSPNGAPGYSPDKITLVIGVNNTVTWTNNDGSTHHTVTSSSVPSGASSFNSGDLAGGATFTYTFTAPGTYQYLCSYHSWMTGTVVVEAGSGSANSTSSTTSSSSSSAAVINGLAISMPSGAGSPNGAPGYAPDNITLVIGVNATVTWVNNDSAHHTVTSTSTPPGASFNSGDIKPGATFTYTFTVPGTYQYTCSYHSWMVGTITVVQG
jgi:plastocyanin